MERDQVNKEYILFTAANFLEGAAAANYLNLFCEAVSESKRKITVYLFKGRSYRKLRTNDGRRSITCYGVNYNYLGFANRPDGQFLKMVEDLLSIIRTWSVMFQLISRRKSIVILVYSNRFPLNLPVYFIAKLFRIQIGSFVAEYLERNDLQKMSLFQKIKFRSFLLNYTYLNKLSNQLIVFSDFLKKDYVSIGYREDKIIVQPNLTDLAKWYLPGQQINFTLGYAGMPSKKDGITDLIQAVKVLKDQGQPVTLIIVGDSFSEESLIPFFESQCQSLGIADQVTFTGLVPQDKVKEYLNTFLIKKYGFMNLFLLKSYRCRWSGISRRLTID